MARGTPGTVGSKGGGNVVPSTSPDFTALSALGTSASTPNVGFPTRGRVLRSQIPVGRGTVPDDYDYDRVPQRRFPPFTRPPIRPQRPPFISRPSPIRPMPRPSMGSGAFNFYRRPSYNYGVPTGLGSLLSGQQSPFGRMVDPATGFPQRSFPRPIMGRPDFGQIGRSTSSGKSGSKGGAKTVTPEPKDLPISDNRINLDSFRQLNPQIETGEGFRLTHVPLTPPPVRDFTGAPPPMMDASQYLRTDQPIMRSQGPESQRNRPALAPPPPPPPPSFVLQAPSIAPPSSPIIPDVRQQIEREIQMEQAGVRPNVRPTMNVGKATGGPVGIHSGIASLVGRR